MKRFGDLWDQVVSWPNLLLAARKARRGQRKREVVQRFDFHLERRLLELQEQLQDGAYVPGPFTTHWNTRPKPRLISAAPYRDRVVHHAVMNVLEPILDRGFNPTVTPAARARGPMQRPGACSICCAAIASRCNATCASSFPRLVRPRRPDHCQRRLR